MSFFNIFLHNIMAVVRNLLYLFNNRICICVLHVSVLVTLVLQPNDLFLSIFHSGNWKGSKVGNKSVRQDGYRVSKYTLYERNIL